MVLAFEVDYERQLQHLWLASGPYVYRAQLSFAYETGVCQLVIWPTRPMWRVDLLILHSAWRVDHTGVTIWLLVGRVVGFS